jgi:hypothetical protein
LTHFKAKWTPKVFLNSLTPYLLAKSGFSSIRYKQLARLRDKNVSLSYSYKNLRHPQSTAFYAPNEVFINFLQKLYK